MTIIIIITTFFVASYNINDCLLSHPRRGTFMLCLAEHTLFQNYSVHTNNTRSCRARQGRRRLRCACWWRTSSMGGYYVSMNASCADDQNLKIVRCSTFQGRWYPDFWRVTKNPLNRYLFSRGIYYVFWSSDSNSEFFFTVWAKVLNKVIVVGSGQNKNLLR